jgi:hypothetical protein
MLKLKWLWVVCFVALLTWIGFAFAQTANPGTIKTVKMPTGEEVFDISGEWDVYVENLNALSIFGTYQQIFKITQEGNSFTGIRLKDNPPPSPGKAGSTCMQGEVDKNGIKKIELITSAGARLPSVCKISEDGNKINIDGFDSELPTRSQLVRQALIRK